MTTSRLHLRRSPARRLQRPEPARRCRDRPDRSAKVAAAQVVLRQGRQRTVRGHHPAAGVLPHPHRAVDPDSTCRRDHRGGGHRHADRARLGIVGEDPLLLDALTVAGIRRTVPTSRWTSARTPCGQRAPGWSRCIRELRVGALRADFTHQLDLLPRGRCPHRRLPRRHHRQLRSGRAGRVSARSASRPRPGRSLPARRRPGQVGRRAGPGLRRRGRRDRRVQPQRAGRAEPAAGRRLRPHGLRARRGVGRGAASGSRCGCGRLATIVAQVPERGSHRSARPGEEIRTEISAKFRRAGLTAELQAAGFVERGWWTDEREWFSVSLWGAG